MVTVMAAALFLAACGSSDESGSTDGFPVVQIAGLQLVGTDATMTYSAFDAGNDLAITIDWGDGSPLQGFEGQGNQTASHSYEVAVTAVTVTVTGTDADGNVGSDSRSVDLVDAAGTTSPDTTSTEPPATTTPDSTATTTTSTATTTTTTPPPPPTPTTTTATTTSTTTTTTTTEPPPDPIVIALDLDDATMNATERSTYSEAVQIDGDRLGVYASTAGIGNDPVVASITATWSIAANRFAAVGPDPLVSVFFETRSVVSLCTDDDDFRAAFRLSAAADAGGQQIGTSDAGVLQHAGVDGESCRSFDPDRATLGFGGPSEGGDVTISITVRCEAVQPGFAIFDSAQCGGRGTRLAAAELREARVTFRPNE